ncbi:unnamed protein product [Cuscuta epithymum]|uniref:C2H2-type domain-containing protein n=1 Tax=Cuscuta epithymum TaxID=186058 RepID=A0AAV0CHX0_9ASTE|nr:unnamed protein product [Cuscuta epithymum]
MMNTTMFNSIQLKNPFLIVSKQHSSLTFSFNPLHSLSSKPSFFPKRALRWSIRSFAAEHEIDMVRNKQGVYTAKSKKVVVLWDLDNKPPRGPPYQAAVELKRVAQKFGEVVHMSAYANRHAFSYLPRWVVDQRRERRRLDVLERKGDLTPPEPYVCSVCGRKCKTNLDLKKHFKQLHERERQKKLNRMTSLKGKKRQRYKERFIDGNHKYVEAARSLITPKVGYGLGSDLKRAEVFVKTVADKPQAADLALKQQMQHSLSRGVDWVFLVSDDSDFSEMLRKAGQANLGTVVVGDSDSALGRHADLWVPWIRVEKGDITENDLVLKRKENSWAWSSNHKVSVSQFDGGEEEVRDGPVERRQLSDLQSSAFCETDDLDVWEECDDDSIYGSDDDDHEDFI